MYIYSTIYYYGEFTLISPAMMSEKPLQCCNYNNDNDNNHIARGLKLICLVDSMLFFRFLKL